MECELIGEFKGKNTVYRILPRGRMEVSGQGTGKILGVEAFLASTSTGALESGVFSGKVFSVITTMQSETLTMEAYAVGYPSENGGVTRGASVQKTTSATFMQLANTFLLHEFLTDMSNNWTGKIWKWK